MFVEELGFIFQSNIHRYSVIDIFLSPVDYSNIAEFQVNFLIH